MLRLETADGQKLALSTIMQDGPDGYDVALILLTTELLALAIRRVEAFRHAQDEDMGLASFDYHDCSPDFYRGDFDEYYTCDSEYGGEPVPKPLDSDDDDNRTEAEYMVVDEDGIYWSVIAKHTDVRIDTERVPYAVLVALLKETQQ